MLITIDPNNPPSRTDSGWRPGGSGVVARMPTFAELVERDKANGKFDPKAAAAHLRQVVDEARTHVGFDVDWSRAVLAKADEYDRNG